MHLTRLADLSSTWSHLEIEGALDDDNRGEIENIVNNLFEWCVGPRWNASRICLSTTKQWLGSGRPLYQAAPSEIRHIIETVQQEMAEQEFFVLARDRAHYFDKNNLFGSAVAASFPDANDDIQEAGNCLAAGRNTAATFHLMRVAEWGLRGLCADVGLIRIRRRKGGQTRYTPIAYSQWEDMLNQLPAKIDAKTEKLKRGPKKQAAQTHYYSLLHDIKGIKDAFRNHIMHTRVSYTSMEADAIFEYVKRIMITLAGGVQVKEPTSHSISRLVIQSARWGVGDPDYHDVTEILRGYIASGVPVRASINYFADRFPRQHKHMVVKFSLPGDAKNVRTHSFKEGDLIKFKK
jgi:hypothetical protein